MNTEAEAKTKWCPLARMAMAQSATPGKGRCADMGFAIGSPSSFNRVTVSNHEGVTIPDASLCIGSACMAWRAVHERQALALDDLPAGSAWERDGKEILGPAGNPHTVQNWKREAGYCGAFGSPE